MTKRYEIYKDSGVQWLGEIPEHWSCIKLKAFCKDNKEKNKGNVESCVLSLSYGNVIVKQNVNFGLVPDNYESYQIVKPGYIILRLTDLQNDHKSLRTGLVKHRGIITSAYVGLVVNNINNEYVHLLLHSYDVMKVFYGLGGGLRQSMSYQDISNLYVPVPPLTEQQDIVSYITDKCAKIDKSIETMEKQIALLQEMKQRVIADAVTRGLDKTVKMKKSGIAWLDEVPEHWGEKKMKYLFTERSEKNHPNEPMLSATQNEGVILQSKYKGRIVEVNTGFEGLKLVKVGDFVIHLRSFQGGIEYTYDQGIISSAYTILTPNNENESPYYKYLFKSHSYIQLLKTCVTGIREGQNINYSKLKQHFIPLPPLSEQRAIVSYLNERTTKIETLAKKIEQEIVYLKEYKQRLISDVVTGQVKVC